MVGLHRAHYPSPKVLQVFFVVVATDSPFRRYHVCSPSNIGLQRNAFSRIESQYWNRACPLSIYLKWLFSLSLWVITINIREKSSVDAIKSFLDSQCKSKVIPKMTPRHVMFWFCANFVFVNVFKTTLFLSVVPSQRKLLLKVCIWTLKQGIQLFLNLRTVRTITADRSKPSRRKLRTVNRRWIKSNTFFWEKLN